MASVQGERGMPHPRPPYPAESGLWGCPTLINNVETFANVPIIIRKGANWFASIGTEKSKGTKVFALAGKIKNTGLIEVPMGTSLRKIVEEIGGGAPNGAPFSLIPFVSGPMFQTSQCVNNPLGASGSSTTKTRLFVPAGGSSKCKVGFTLEPSQVNFDGMLAPC